MVKHAMQSVAVMAAASLLFACGGSNPEVSPATQAKSAKSLSPAAQCSDGATIAAGWYHTVGLKSDGTVMATGDARNGRLDVSMWTDIQAVAAGNLHTVGLKTDGTVTAVGDNSKLQLNVSPWTDIQAVAAGSLHTVGLKSDGTVTAVGDNSKGQLNVSPWKDIQAIAAGSLHTVGLKTDGTVTAVGDNSKGQLNVSTWTNIKAIAAGNVQTFGLKDDGTIVAVGYNGNGQLNVTTWTNITAIAAGVFHSVGLKDDGTVAAAGSNSYGQMNVSSWTNIMPVCGANKDITPPITKDVITGKMGNNGWYVSDVQVTLNATDNPGGSGVKEIHFGVDGAEIVAPGNSVSTVGQASSASSSIAVDGAHAVTYYAIDNAGNVESQHQMSINIDTTPPTIIATVSPSPNANGWNNTDVTVTFACSDNASGIASCPAPITVTTEGAGQVITDTAVDKAGLSAKVSVTLNIDKTPPSIPSLSATPSMLWPPNYKMVKVQITGSAADDGSGIASTIISVTDEYGIYNMTVPGNMTVAGFGSTIRLASWRASTDKDGRLYTITAVTTDKAGNASTGKTTVLVPHDMRSSFKERDDDKFDHDKDHHERGDHDRHHGLGFDRDDRGEDHRHESDRDAQHEGGHSLRYKVD